MRTNARPLSPAAATVEQLPLPLIPAAPPTSLIPTERPTATILVPQQVWGNLLPARQRQVRLVFLRVLQEVVGDACHDAG